MKRKNNFHIIISNGILLIIFIFALVIRMSFFLSLKPWNNEVVNKIILQSGDANEYHKDALSLLSKKTFEDFNGFRDPWLSLFCCNNLYDFF